MPDFESFAHSKNEVTYPASCHCGKSRFTVTIPPLDTISITSCNCSICAINGYLNIYPLRKNIAFQSPYEELGSYVFASQTRVHKFCKTCGTSLLVDFENAEDESSKKHNAVNVWPSALCKDHERHANGKQVRTLKDVDISKLDIQHFDGKNLL